MSLTFEEISYIGASLNSARRHIEYAADQMKLQNQLIIAAGLMNTARLLRVKTDRLFDLAIKRGGDPDFTPATQAEPQVIGAVEALTLARKLLMGANAKLTEAGESEGLRFDYANDCLVDAIRLIHSENTRRDKLARGSGIVRP